MVHRVRKRARVRSISLRTFGWVCAREAAFSVLAPYYTERGRKLLQVVLCRLPLAVIRRMMGLAVSGTPPRWS